MSASSTVTANTAATADQYNNLRKDGITGLLYYLTSIGGTANAITAVAEAQFTAYEEGNSFNLKIGITNTSATTININSLGAKDIKKFTSSGITALSGGELIANQIVSLIYDGTQFIITNNIAPRYSHGTAQRSISSGTQNIAHNLTAPPSRIRISCKAADDGTDRIAVSDGAYDGSTTSCNWASDEAANSASNVNTTYIAWLQEGGRIFRATVTVTSTNIVLVWDSPATAPTFDTSVNIFWEAWIDA